MAERLPRGEPEWRHPSSGAGDPRCTWPAYYLASRASHHGGPASNTGSLLMRGVKTEESRVFGGLSLTLTLAPTLTLTLSLTLTL